jgi:indolepyruvate ferredoxin oxidoreductase beta subunit
MPVVIGAMEYPQDTMAKIQEKTSKTIALDALDMAMKCKNPKGVNVVLLGVLSALMDISEEVWLDVLKEKVPSKFLEVNLAAFAAGRGYGMK